MSTESSIEQNASHLITVLEEPVKQITDGIMCDVYAYYIEEDESGEEEEIAAATVYVQSRWAERFSLFIGDSVETRKTDVTAQLEQEVVYYKSISQFVPLYGLRLALAKKKAARRLAVHLA